MRHRRGGGDDRGRRPLPALLLAAAATLFFAVAGATLAQGPAAPAAQEQPAPAPAPAPAPTEPGTPAPAPAPAPAPPAKEPTLVVSASLASLAKVDALAKDVGLGELPFLSPGFIEQRMPFIGAGGLAADRPIGLLFFADPAADLEKSLTFVLPVNPGKAELKQFVEQGATPVDGRADLVTMGMVSFRRAKELFVFGQLAGAVAAVREDVFTAVYAKDPDAVARVDVDIAAFKAATPERYGAFFAEVGEIADVKDGVQQASADVVSGWMRGLTHLGLSIARGTGDGVRVSLRAKPFDAANLPAGKLTRAGFPEGTIARADLALPPARAIGGVTAWLEALLARDEQIAKLNPEQKAQVHAFVGNFARLLLDGEAGSFGVGKLDGQPVAYAVTRRPDPKLELEAEMKGLVAQSDEVEKILGDKDKPSATYESYDAAGGKVHRLVLMEGGKPQLHVDAVRREGTVSITVSPAGGKFVERLLSAKTEGEATAPASGWVDLAALVESGAVIPEAEAASLDPKTLAAVKEAVKGQRLDWTAAPDDGGGLRVDVNVPKPLLQKMPQVVQSLQ